MHAPDRAALDALMDRLRRLESVLVAFSGGVDSALVLRAAVLALGAPRVLAVTGRSASVPSAELDGVARLAADLGSAHEFLDTAEFDDPRYLANPANRCYFCKSELYSKLLPLAAARRLRHVVNGVNADDLGDFRPGISAASESGVVAPLAELGIGKAALRRMALALGLAVHDKPASPCLASRVQYGETITPEKLARIDAAETFLRHLGFSICRVRHHDELARIEVPVADLPRLLAPQVRDAVEARLRELGYRYVTVDLRGFRSGSMNEVLVGAALRGAMSD